MRRILSVALLAWVLAPAACAQDPGAKPGLARPLADDANTFCALTDVCQISAHFDAGRGRCVYQTQPDGTACDDQDVCTATTTCQAGRCVGQALACPARGPCFLDGACDPSLGCIDVPLEGPCMPGLTAVPMAGCCSADYTAPITLGTDTLNLIIDSGSTTTAAASTACSRGCEGLAPVYDLAGASATSQKQVSSQYGDGSAWSGPLVTDHVAVAGVTGPMPYTFAAMARASVDDPPRTTAFFTADRCQGAALANTRQGIFGLGNAPLASRGADTFMDLLAGEGIYDAFSTQFCNTTGRLWLGGYDPAFVDSSFLFVPMDTSDGFYRVAVDDILVDGISLGLEASMFGPPGGEPIVDNGTSIMSFPSQVARRVVAALEKNGKFSAQFPASMFLAQPQCLRPASGDLSRTELNAMLPSFALVLRQAAGGRQILELPPTASYLTYARAEDGGGQYCPTLGDSGEDLYLDSYATILGNAMMRDHIVVFDRAAGQLGFALQKNCFAPDF